MLAILFSFIAIILYLATAGWLGYRIFKLNLPPEGIKIQVITAAGIALLLHAWVLYQGIVTSAGLNLGFYHALSLMCWVVTLLVIATIIIKPVENLAIFFLPVAATALCLELIFQSDHILNDSSTIGLQFHILLSVASYSIFVIAALQAVILAIQDHQLRNKRPVMIMLVLPPMQTMELLLVQLLAIGFFLLSLSLATGMMFVHDIFTQHLAHKTILSILAWLIFALVLWGRLTWGWRGKKLIRWTIGGFVVLMLAYFGSKFVLELVLQRV